MKRTVAIKLTVNPLQSEAFCEFQELFTKGCNEVASVASLAKERNPLSPFVEYKAKGLGIQVKYVNPVYTLQTCSHCLSLSVRVKHCFSCSNCNSLQHSDLNASRTILRLGMSADVPTGDVNHRYVAVQCGR